MMRSKVCSGAIRLVSAKGGGDRRRLLLDLSSVGKGKIFVLPTHFLYRDSLRNSVDNIQGTLLTIAEEEGEEYVDKWLDLFKVESSFAV